MRVFVPLLLLAVVTTGCGQEGDRAGPRPAEGGDTVRTTLYFLADDSSTSLGVRRNVVQRVPPAWGSTPGGALEALIAGPTAEEAETGLTTAIPPETTLISLRSRGYGGTGFVVNLSGLGGG